MECGCPRMISSRSHGSHTRHMILVMSVLLVQLIYVRGQTTLAPIPTTTFWTNAPTNNGVTTRYTPSTASPPPTVAPPSTVTPITLSTLPPASTMAPPATPVTAAPPPVTAAPPPVTAAPPPVTAAPPPVTAAPPPEAEKSIHLQVTIKKTYSDIVNKAKLAEEMKPQMANISGIPPSRIINVIPQEGIDGKLVVTFDVLPSNVTGARKVSEAASTFEMNANKPSEVKVEGVPTTTDKYTSRKWRDEDNLVCPLARCPTNERCWQLQTTRSCVCLTCPKAPSPPPSDGLDSISIIVIIVVASVVALVVIIVVVVCILKSSRRRGDKDDESSEGSRYSDDSEHYHTNFDN